MKERYYNMKIGRDEIDIDENDVIFDNGSCYQLISRETGHGFNKCSPIVSNTLFNKLLKNNQIRLVKDKHSYFMTNGEEVRFKYYKFNMDKIKES